MKINLQSKSAALAPLMAICVLGATSITHAQPDVPASASFRQQMQETSRRGYEQSWRTMLGLSGVKEAATQDAVVALLGEQQQRLDLLRFQAHLLAKAVASPNVPDAQIGMMLQELRVALKAEQERRALAQTALKTKLNTNQDPRTETLLMFHGVLGDEAGILDAVPQALLRLRVKTVPEAMKMLAVTDPQAQTMILRYVTAQEKLFKPPLEWGKQTKSYFGTMPTPPTDEERRTFLSEYRESAGELHVRSQKALVKLDAAIGYIGKPRLEAALFLMGVLGDEDTLLTGFDGHGLTAFTRSNDLVTGEEVTH